MTRTRPLLVLCAAAALVAACNQQPELDVTAGGTAAAPVASAAPPIAADAELPPGHPPIGGGGHPGGMPPGAGPAPDPAAAQGMGMMVTPGGEGDQAVTWTAPAGWVEEPPANSVRRAQYRVPGSGGDAELVVFYFGPGQGGDPQANAQRWASQFVDAQGAPATPRTRGGNVAGMDVLYVEAEGNYQQGAMTGGPVEQKGGHALLAAVVEGPDSNWFFKLTGPKATVEAQRAAFESLIGSLRPGAAGGNA